MWVIDRATIASVFPHADGFTFVDRLHIASSGATWAEWTPRTTDPVVRDHFTGYHVVPGVILIEACAQVAGLACAVAAASTARGHDRPAPAIEMIAERWYVVTDVRDARLRRLVVGGTPLAVEPETPRGRRGIWTCRVTVHERTSKRAVATVELRLAEMARTDVVARVARAAAGAREAGDA
jgi:3-hydroxyacyl-[acyl-carrier-protein] dehydratase